MQSKCAGCDGSYTIALAGNPNVGKSTIFNRLTGLKQHTGNWPGKTVSEARGRTNLENRQIDIVDTPGTYSLLASSEEEEVARDYICFGDHNCVVVVADATCLERNLNLVLQIGEITGGLVLCVNLLDEAARKGIHINQAELSAQLGVPVVFTSARSGRGIKELLRTACGESKPGKAVLTEYPAPVEEGIRLVGEQLTLPKNCKITKRFLALKLIEGNRDFINTASLELGIHLRTDELNSAVLSARELISEEFGETPVSEIIVNAIVNKAESIYLKSVSKGKRYGGIDHKLDNLLTSKSLGIPIMLALLLLILWITIVGANYPSQMLASAFNRVEEWMRQGLIHIGAGETLTSLITDGVARTLFWVVSVMLPPMAIFFPLFTILEDLGYLPRIAFNMDGFFAKAGTCGKQGLTMCMGLGCNAAGVTGCRIIDSPRERLIAMVTNTFMPCNGRFPSMIAVSALIFSAAGLLGSICSALTLLAVIVAGVAITLATSKLLSKTLLKGVPSSFTLELPPYRKPDYLRVIYRSIIDRTLFVLGRAVAVAAPAGLIIWLMANLSVGGSTLLNHCAGFLQPLGNLMGLDGYILMAFILGFPANEIVVPIVMMSYLGAGTMIEAGSTAELLGIFTAHGWTWLTAVCFLVFSLVHFPCSTTCITIKKESGSFKWAALSFILPTVMGIILCIIIASAARLFGIA